MLLIQWIAWRFLPAPADYWYKQTDYLLPLKAEQLKGATLDTVTQKIQVTEKAACINWPDDVVAGVHYLQLTIECNAAVFPTDWILQYKTSSFPWFDEGIIAIQSVRPLLSSNEGAVLTWHLPAPAQAVRLLIPKGAQFRISRAEMRGTPPATMAWEPWRQALTVCCFALNAGLFLSWACTHVVLLKQVCLQPAFLGTLILLIHGGVIIWLLPPFQGPDENRHWKQAIRLFRSDGQKSSVLYMLPFHLDAEAPRWQSQIPFHAADLKSDLQMKRGPIENKEVPYVQHWGYPLVGLVSLLFPTVQTVSEALVFYYTCRIIALLCLILLVASAWRMGLGSWSLTIFLAFPLVLQQCTIVSTDATHNLGTFLAILLFRRHQTTKSNASWLFLLLVCCLVVASKPPIYLTIMILPVWFLPWAKVFRPVILFPALLILISAIVVGLWLLWSVVDNEGMNLGEQARKQLQYVFSAEGFSQFITAGMEYPTRFFNPACWWEPLGWLDTRLNDLHRKLLWLCLILAITIDVSRIGLWLRRTGLNAMGDLLPPLVCSLVHLVFVWWSLALVMYLTITDLQSAGIVGMQVRYMIPVALMFLIWPTTTLLESQRMRFRYNILWPVLLLVILTIIRAIQLAGDLQYRYWG